MTDHQASPLRPCCLPREELGGPRFDFDPTSDTLHVYLHGTPVPAISIVVDDHLSLRISIETSELVGYQIDDFLRDAVRQVPAYRVIARLLNLPVIDTEHDWRELTTEQRQQVAAALLVGHVGTTEQPAPS